MCKGEVEGFTQKIGFIFQPDELVQLSEEMTLSCGCLIDFPDWQIDPVHGICRIYDFAGKLYIEFNDENMLMDEEEED